MIGLAFRDLPHHAAGGLIVPQIGDGAGRELEFLVDDEDMLETRCCAALEKVQELWSRMELKEPRQCKLDLPTGGDAVLLLTPVVSGFDNPIGCFWVLVDEKVLEKAQPRIEYVATYVSRAVRAEKACAAIEQLSSQDLNVPSSSNAIADAVAEAGRLALAAAAVVVWIVDKSRGALKTRGFALDPPGRVHLDMNIGEGIAGKAVQNGKPVMLNDLLDEDELKEKSLGVAHHRDLVKQRNWRAAIFVPLDIGGEAAGVIAAYAKRQFGFSEIDLHILQAFANRMSAGLANADRIQMLTEMERRIIQAAPAIEAGRLALENVHDAIEQLLHAQNYLSTALYQAARGVSGVPEIEQALVCVDKGKKRIHSLTRLARFSEVRKTRVSLREFLDRAVDQVRNEAAKIRVNVEVKCPHAWRIRVDEDKLQRVFANLFANSLWFLERDTKGMQKLIRISAEQVDEGLMIKFYDNGPGIESSKLERVFDYLFTTRMHEGMGLGLAIVRQLIHAHGGTVRAASKWGYHTEMIIHLPGMQVEFA
ncbi:GAF domain-containing sensor histidine kinase [Verrucomicrobium sp. BvORR034]|uniref:sensor histidine kinase n=1 Tax=Verrucomicrobium sp. BvORR034 TaxID=1396418 RepID=UPI000A4913E6|nr:GAF domain-containing sensor histidine kinase [Verrucomicrobium sp. BvORR034]